jgi:glutamate formiminotransferase
VLRLEAVPNFSEGRDRAVIDAVGEALGAHARLLDVHSDEDHNRSVFTLVGSAGELVTALLAGIGVARERIDLRRHEGAHPRIGAADVVPIVPIRPDDAERARAAALELAGRVGEELGLPVFLYADLAPGRGPAFFRRGGPEELQRRIDAGELAPDFGPPRLDPGAGGVIVGARPPLIAFNIDLAGDDLEAVREVACARWGCASRGRGTSRSASTSRTGRPRRCTRSSPRSSARHERVGWRSRAPSSSG